MMEKLTKEQIELVQRELSINGTGKYNHFLGVLQDKFDSLNAGYSVHPANILYLEELVKKIKSIKGFTISFQSEAKGYRHSIHFYDDVLTQDIDEIILKHTKIRVYKDGAQSIIVNFNHIVKDIEKQVKAYLKAMKEYNK